MRHEEVRETYITPYTHYDFGEKVRPLSWSKFPPGIYTVFRTTPPHFPDIPALVDVVDDVGFTFRINARELELAGAQ